MYENQKQDVNCFIKEIYLPDIMTLKCVHITYFLCWFALILGGTTIIGFGASNYSLNIDYCAEGTTFCSQDITLDATKELYFYIILDPFYQNNRL